MLVGPVVIASPSIDSSAYESKSSRAFSTGSPRSGGSRDSCTVNYRAGGGTIAVYSVTSCAKHDKVASNNQAAAVQREVLVSTALSGCAGRHAYRHFPGGEQTHTRLHASNFQAAPTRYLAASSASQSSQVLSIVTCQPSVAARVEAAPSSDALSSRVVHCDFAKIASPGFGVSTISDASRFATAAGNMGTS